MMLSVIHTPTTYHKFPLISRGLIFVQRAFLLGLFSGELIIGGNFAFQNGLDLTIKTAQTLLITA